MSEQRPSASLRRLVAERARRCCEYCKSQEAFCPDTFSIEHIIPRARNGATAAENLAFSCQGCNGHKSDQIEATDPVTAERVPLFHPRLHRWEDHFSWDHSFATIIGISAVGRVTVHRMRLNRAGLQNLRRALHTLGLHPPS
jgi:hypothetical protein